MVAKRLDPNCFPVSAQLALDAANKERRIIGGFGTQSFYDVIVTQLQMLNWRLERIESALRTEGVKEIGGDA